MSRTVSEVNESHGAIKSYRFNSIELFIRSRPPPPLPPATGLSLPPAPEYPPPPDSGLPMPRKAAVMPGRLLITS